MLIVILLALAVLAWLAGLDLRRRPAHLRPGVRTTRLASAPVPTTALVNPPFASAKVDLLLPTGLRVPTPPRWLLLLGILALLGGLGLEPAALPVAPVAVLAATEGDKRHSARLATEARQILRSLKRARQKGVERPLTIYERAVLNARPKVQARKARHVARLRRRARRLLRVRGHGWARVVLCQEPRLLRVARERVALRGSAGVPAPGTLVVLRPTAGMQARTNETVVRVRNRKGLPVHKGGQMVQERTFTNTALAELAPDVAGAVVLVDWERTAEQGRRKVGLSKVKSGGKVVRYRSSSLEAPVRIDGEPYDLWGWGSSVKDGKTLHLRRGVKDPSALVIEKAEDVQRLGQKWLAEGNNGFGHGELVVQFIGLGEEEFVQYGPYGIGDGFALFADEVVRPILTGARPSELDSAKPSAQLSQWIPLEGDGVREEVRQLVIGQLKDFYQDVKERAASFTSHMVQDNWLVKQLLSVGEEWAEHPFVARAAGRGLADFMFRLATSLELNASYKVAVPAPTWILPGLDEGAAAGAGRYPFSAVPLAVEANVRPESIPEPDWEQMVEAIEEAEVIQYRMTARHHNNKGAALLVPRAKLMGGVDAVICIDNVKMDALNIQSGEIVLLEDSCLTVTAHWDAGSAAGVPPKPWKSRAGDFDGDGVVYFDLTDLQGIYNALKNGRVYDTSKPPKGAHPYDRSYVAEFAALSMENLIGNVANLQAEVLMFSEGQFPSDKYGMDDRDDALSAAAFDSQLAVDMYKSIALARRAKARQGRIFGQRKAFAAVNHGQPYPLAAWKRWGDFHVRGSRVDDEAASPWFVTQIPEYDDPMFLDTDQPHMSSWFEGIVPFICSMTLPRMKRVLEQSDLRFSYRPLVDWRELAPEASGRAIFAARRAHREWHTLRQTFDFRDDAGDSVAAMDRFQAASERLFRMAAESFGLDEGELANALWRVSHSSSNDLTAAASMFYMAPDHALMIARGASRAGIVAQAEALTTKLIGLGYAFGYSPKDLDREPAALLKLELPVEVRAFEQGDGPTRKMRYEVVRIGEVEGMVQEKVGVIPADAPDKPAPGRYHAVLRRLGATKAWHVELSPLD